MPPFKLVVARLYQLGLRSVVPLGSETVNVLTDSLGPTSSNKTSTGTDFWAGAGPTPLTSSISAAIVKDCAVYLDQTNCNIQQLVHSSMEPTHLGQIAWMWATGRSDITLLIVLDCASCIGWGTCCLDATHPKQACFKKAKEGILTAVLLGCTAAVG